MQFKKFLENPIGDIGLIGKGWEKFSNGQQHQGWDKASFNILKNGGIEKIKNVWKNTQQMFDMYFVKDVGMTKTLQDGQVDADYLASNKINIPVNPTHITIIFTNNIAAEKVPLTPWTAAHRFGHAISNSNQNLQYLGKVIDRDLKSVAEQVYAKYDPKIKLAIMHAIGTMRSAQTGNIFREGEFIFELLAQHLVTGQITFNPELPKSIPLKKVYGNVTSSAYSQIEKDEMYKREIGDFIISLADFYTGICKKVLGECIGKIYVM